MVCTKTRYIPFTTYVFSFNHWNESVSRVIYCFYPRIKGMCMTVFAMTSGEKKLRVWAICLVSHLFINGTEPVLRNFCKGYH